MADLVCGFFGALRLDGAQMPTGKVPAGLLGRILTHHETAPNQRIERFSVASDREENKARSGLDCFEQGRTGLRMLPFQVCMNIRGDI